jgi:ornithine cyclodeaminase
VVIGTGAQAADQVRAVRAVRPIDHVTLVGRDRARADALATALADELGDAPVEVVLDVDAALAAADVVCCATTAQEPLFSVDALPEQVHVNAIGSFRPTMRELPDELLGGGLVVIDDRAAILEESGEILHALAAGAITADDLVELGVALTEGLDRTPRTSFKSVGVAVQDWAVARLLADRFLDQRTDR